MKQKKKKRKDARCMSTEISGRVGNLIAKIHSTEWLKIKLNNNEKNLRGNGKGCNRDEMRNFFRQDFRAFES